MQKYRTFPYSRTKQKIVLVIFGLFLSVLMLEILMRAGGLIYLSLQESRNRKSLNQKGNCRIMCVGESTTGSGGKLSYPRQLEEIINQRKIGIRFNVINKGIMTVDSGQILSKLEDNLKRYAPDIVVAMMGINDTQKTLAYGYSSGNRKISVFKSFRMYKLVVLIGRHFANKVRELKSGIEKNNRIDIGFKKESVKTGDINEKSNNHGGKLKPKDENEYIRLGDNYMKKYKHTRALEMYANAKKINSKNENIYIKLARCYLEQHDWTKAEKNLRNAVEINPENTQAYCKWGDIYEMQGKIDKAIEKYKKVIEIDPGDFVVNYKLAGWYIYKGNYNEAKKRLRACSSDNHEGDKIYRLMAVIQRELGDVEAAGRLIQKADEIITEDYNPITKQNYKKFKEIVTNRGIKLVCVQYPMRNIKPLKKMLEPYDNIIFVDNNSRFKEAVRQEGYNEYFLDIFAGDFGHCTDKGNRLLAENIADDILKKYFNK